jgi:hypothetical protein
VDLSNNELSKPATGQVIVRVEASGISFAEQAMRRDRYPGQPAFPFPTCDGTDPVAPVHPVINSGNAACSGKICGFGNSLADMPYSFKNVIPVTLNAF